MQQFAATFVVVLVSSLLSGLSGGGGGFVMTPYFLLMGLTPQQNIAVGSVIGLGLSGGSLTAVRGKQLVNRQFARTLVVLTVLVSIAATAVLPHVRATISRVFIGWFVLTMIPTLFVRRGTFQPGERSKRATMLGYALYTVLWFANAVFSAGFAALLFVPLLFCLGLTALEANATKRLAALAQAAVLFVMLAPQGLIRWNFAIASLLGSWIGGRAGTHIAIKNGERFARMALAAVMLISAVLLLKPF